MTNRPYINLSIGDLEAIAQNHWDDLKFLKKLKGELKYRQTKRAKELLSKLNIRLSEEFGRMIEEKKFCTECGQQMEIKHGRYGMFWGCSGYPHCRHTVKITKSDFA